MDAEAIATTSAVLAIAGLVGMLVVTCVVALRSSRHGPAGGGGPRRGQGQPVLIRSTLDLDVELFRILDDERLGDPSTHRRARLQDRWPGAA